MVIFSILKELSRQVGSITIHKQIVKTADLMPFDELVQMFKLFHSEPIIGVSRF